MESLYRPSLAPKLEMGSFTEDYLDSGKVKMPLKEYGHAIEVFKSSEFGKYYESRLVNALEAAAGRYGVKELLGKIEAHREKANKYKVSFKIKGLEEEDQKRKPLAEPKMAKPLRQATTVAKYENQKALKEQIVYAVKNKQSKRPVANHIIYKRPAETFSFGGLFTTPRAEVYRIKPSKPLAVPETGNVSPLENVEVPEKPKTQEPQVLAAKPLDPATILSRIATQDLNISALPVPKIPEAPSFPRFPQPAVASTEIEKPAMVEPFFREAVSEIPENLRLEGLAEIEAPIKSPIASVIEAPALQAVEAPKIEMPQLAPALTKAVANVISLNALNAMPSVVKLPGIPNTLNTLSVSLNMAPVHSFLRPMGMGLMSAVGQMSTMPAMSAMPAMSDGSGYSALPLAA